MTALSTALLPRPAAPIGLASAGSAGTFRLIAAPRPFSDATVELALPEGGTIAELLAAAGVDPATSTAHVFVGDTLIPRGWWGRVRPRAGSLVTLRAVPLGGGGGGGKNPLRMLLSIAVMAASFVVAPMLAPGLAAATGLSVGTAQAIASAGISIVGNLLINALIPPPVPRLSSGGRDPQSFTISGTRNEFDPWAPIPVVLGRTRIWPRYAAKPFTELVGDEQYLRALFLVGYGPVKITELKIGDTPLGEHQGVEVEIREGHPSDPPRTLFTQDVDPQPYQIVLRQASGWVTRTAEREADELSVEVTFPAGLAQWGSDGKRDPFEVRIEIAHAPAGTESWTTLPVWVIREERQTPFRRGRRWTVPRGQYKVRLRRLTADLDQQNTPRVASTTSWTLLTTYRHVAPISFPKRLATVALRIKADEQLSGVVDSFNCVTETICPDFDVATGTWITRATANPASIGRWILQGPAKRRPLADARLDLPAWEAMHERCRVEGWSVSHLVDYVTTTAEILRDVLAVGRASRGKRDGRHSVVEDRPQTAPVQLFTPRNSWGFRAVRHHRRAPHGLRMQFRNRDLGWQPDEVVAYMPGFSAATATDLEPVELPHIDDKIQAWETGMYMLAQARFRPVTWYLSVDAEYLVARRGQWVKLAHDAVLLGIEQARIKALTLDGGDIVAIGLDAAVPMQAGKSYGLSVRTPDDAAVTIPVTTVDDTVTTLVPVTPVPEGLIEPGDLVAFGETGRVTRDALLRSIRPLGPDLDAELELIPLAPEVHDPASLGTPYDPGITRPVPLTGGRPARPVILSAVSDETVMVRDAAGTWVARIVIQLAPPSGDAPYPARLELRRRAAGSTAWEESWTLPPGTTIVSVAGVEEEARYDVEIRAVGAGDPGRPSEWAGIYGHKVIGQTTLPYDLSALFRQGDGITWPYPNPPPDLWGFIVRVAAGVTADISQAAPAHSGVVSAPPFPLSALGSGTRTVFVTAIDTGGRESLVPARLVLDGGDPILANVVWTQAEHPAWPGAISGGAVAAGELAGVDTELHWQEQDGALYWRADDDYEFWSEASWDAVAYEFTVTAPRRGRITVAAEVTAPQGWSLSLVVPHEGETVWQEQDSAPWWYADDDHEIWPAGPPPMTAFWPGEAEVAGGEVLRFRLVLAGGSGRPVAHAATATMDVETLVQTFDDVAISAGGTRVEVEGMEAIRYVQVTLQHDGGDAFAWKVMDKQLPGPLIRLFDRDGDPTPGLIDATIGGIPAP